MSPQVCQPPRASYNIWRIKKISPSFNVFIMHGKREKISCNDSYVFSTLTSHIRSFTRVIFIPSLVVMVTKKVSNTYVNYEKFEPNGFNFFQTQLNSVGIMVLTAVEMVRILQLPPYTMTVKVRAFKFTPGTSGFFHTFRGHQSMQNRRKDHGKCNTCMLNKLQVKDQSRSYSRIQDLKLWVMQRPSLIER